MTDDTTTDLTALTADVVSAYVANNTVRTEELAHLISTTYQALKGVETPQVSEPEHARPDKAAIRKSQHPDFLTSFVDGKKYKSLKRHLTTNGLTPNEYRERYGLGKDYPMVASNYSAQRSALAKSLGLGRKAGEGAKAAASATAAKGAGRGRAKAIKPQDESFS